VIRPATDRDAAAIAELVGQLGYPADASEVIPRLEHLRDFPATIVLVAEVDGRVVGVITGQVMPSIHSTPPVAWLTTLVVADDCHGRGIGRELTHAVEAWARAKGAARISLTSGKHRHAAHAFYEHLGYERTGVRLTKAL
jgi:GNAT superfamily N-acetyltransferase